MKKARGKQRKPENGKLLNIVKNVPLMVIFEEGLYYRTLPAYEALH